MVSLNCQLDTIYNLPRNSINEGLSVGHYLDCVSKDG